jgi:hypothetical protein
LITGISSTGKKEKAVANCISVLDKPSKSSKFRVQSSKLEKQGKYLSENFLLVIHISYLITFLLIFALFPSASAAIKDRVVAFVDNSAITLSELDEVYSESLKRTPDITKDEVLNTMVNRVLLLREAKKLHLEAPSEEKLLQDYIDLKIRPRIKIKEEDVSDFYQKHINDFQGKEFETVKEEIEHYLAERELNNLLKKHIDELRKKAYIKIQLNPEDTSCQKP